LGIVLVAGCGAHGSTQEEIVRSQREFQLAVSLREEGRVPFIAAHREELSRPELALICDTTMYDAETPAITTMLRGLLAEELTITGPTRDLHSGGFGGIARNPNRVLARIVAALHDERGRITVPGFYDGVDDVPEEVAAQWRALGFDAASFLGAVGLGNAAGEADREPLHQVWARPTCEVNGMWGGYTGAGFKTVLPSEAHAKISFRLVGRQDPAEIRESFRAMVQGMLPPDCAVEFHDHGAAPACVMDLSDPAFEAARQALGDEWPNEAAFIGGGGSIPIAGLFKTILGLDSLLIGFGRMDNRVHSPNEKYDVESFHKGTRSWARVLAAISR
jgi:acetylornithine deacetylase/succinyl-diaminopimelate desuccinylase-like protein